MSKFEYLTCCVASDGPSIQDMVDSARGITLKTFRRRCSTTQEERQLGYDRTFPLSRDWHVAFFRSKYQGRPCYYMVHSAIEYIWCAP